VAIGSNGGTCTFNAALVATAPQVQLLYSTFSGATNNFTQTGTTGNSVSGGNTFASGTATTFTNQGTGSWQLGNAAGDNFDGDVTFVRQVGAGVLNPAYTNNSTFGGNISTTGTATAITFGNNGGRATFNGTSGKALSGGASFSPIFTRFTMNSTGAFTLNVPLTVTADLNLTAGIINTSTNLLTMNAGSVVSGTPSNASHVDGPVTKIGNTAFTFPTGDAGIYRSIGISAPPTATHAFRAEYFRAAQAFGDGSTFSSPIIIVSSCEYWSLSQTTGTSSVSVSLSWNSPDCTGSYVGDLATLLVGRWTGTNWTSEGNGGTTGDITTGTIVSSGALSTYGNLTLASSTLSNPLPITLIEFSVVLAESGAYATWLTASEHENDFFTLERSANGIAFIALADIQGAGTTNVAHRYAYLDNAPLPGMSYYRLKQTDFDGTATYSKVVRFNAHTWGELNVYPNPTNEGWIRFSRPGRFVIMDQFGRILIHVDGEQQLDVSALAVGCYLIRSDRGEVVRLVVE
jgi:hypothetical protein